MSVEVIDAIGGWVTVIVLLVITGALIYKGMRDGIQTKRGLHNSNRIKR